jgi:hypothetical protein
MTLHTIVLLTSARVSSSGALDLHAAAEISDANPQLFHHLINITLLAV